MVKHPLTKPLAEMEWLKKAEEAAGVEIKWQEITADWGQKKGTMLASGDIPDLFIGGNVITDADFAQFQGLFQDMTELLPKCTECSSDVRCQAGNKSYCNTAGRENLRAAQIPKILACFRNKTIH